MTRGELLMVSIILRHGHRSPLKSYPNSPNALFNYNVDAGELTDLGKTEMYYQGSRMRRVYRSLLHKNGHPGFEKALIRSSFLSRAVESAKSFSEGFFNTNDNETVPVIAIPFKEDNLILQLSPCPRFDEAMKELKTNPPKEHRELLESHSTTLKAFSSWSGMSLETVRDGADLYDAIMCEKAYKLAQPKWASEDVLNGVFEDMAAMALALYTWTEPMKKKMAGALITDITRNMMDKVKQPPGRDSIEENIFIYSGHDLTLSTITRALQLDQQIPKIIKTSSGLVFELHSIDGIPMVQIRWFEQNGRMRTLELVGKEPQCRLEDFKEFVKPYMVENLGDLCSV